MAARTLPGLGLKGFWGEGFDGWGDDNDANLRLLSALVQASAISKVAATPGAPANGDVYLFSAAHPTQAGKVAIRDNGAWVYITPVAGWLVYNRAIGAYERYTGADWSPFMTEFVVSDFRPTVNSASQVVFRHQFVREVSLPVALTGSKFAAITAATASAVYTIRKNGASIGTLTWAAAGTVPAVAFAAGVSFVSGDFLDVIGPASPDITLAGMTLTFLGTKV